MDPTLHSAHSPTMHKWYFDLLGEKQDVWMWRVVDEHGTLVKMSTRTFRYYLDCVQNAKRAGYFGRPHFRTPGVKTPRE